MISCERPANGNSFINKYICLDSEKSDIKNLTNGDRVYVIDKGITYIYDEENSSFVEYVSGHGSGGSDMLMEALNGTLSGDVTIEPTTASQLNNTDMYRALFYRCPITSLRWNVVRKIPGSLCQACTQLKTATVYGEFGGDSAFNGCTALESVELPTLSGEKFNYSWAGIRMFSGCRALKSVSMPHAPTVQEYMFSDCTALTMLDLPAVTRIRQGAFNACTALNVLILRADSVCTLENINAFNNSPFASGKAGGTLYVKAAQLEGYQSAANWSVILGYTNNKIYSIEGSEYE